LPTKKALKQLIKKQKKKLTGVRLAQPESLNFALPEEYLTLQDQKFVLKDITVGDDR
jgi:hypothetical protein